MLDFQIDIPKAELARKADLIPVAVQSGLKRVAEHAQQVAIRKAGAIGNRPIPTRGQVNEYRRKRKGSKRRRRTTTNQSEPAWERTGALLNAVKAAPEFERDSVSLKADVEHAQSRHQLGADQYGDLDPWTPKNPALGIIRRDPFFAETAQLTEPQLPELFEDGFNEEWDR